LVRVVTITPAVVRAYDQVAAELRKTLARDKTVRLAQDLRNKIEDARASGQPLSEVARLTGQSVRIIEPVSLAGMDENGQRPDLPAPQLLLSAAFSSAPGVDTDVIATPEGGFVWFETGDVLPPRQRPLAEVRDKVEALWKTLENARLLALHAQDMVDKIGKGATLAALAKEVGVSVQTATEITRSGKEGFSPALVNGVFRTAPGSAGYAAGEAGEGDAPVVFQVTGRVVPPFDPAAQENQALVAALRQGMASDILTHYVQGVQKQLGVSINPALLQAAIGSQAGE
jgi:peptidyl-prolyl cis-trans isomerase D